MRPDDPVGVAMLQHLGDELRAEVGDGVAFAIFIGWRDGGPPSYLSNGARRDVATALDEWLQRTASPAAARRCCPKCGARPERTDPSLPVVACLACGWRIPELEQQAARIGGDLVDEVDVVLFLFTMGDEGTTAWFTNMPGGRELVQQWVRRELGRS
jgi:hypothetical protein